MQEDRPHGTSLSKEGERRERETCWKHPHASVRILTRFSEEPEEYEAKMMVFQAHARTGEATGEATQQSIGMAAGINMVCQAHARAYALQQQRTEVGYKAMVDSGCDCAALKDDELVIGLDGAATRVSTCKTGEGFVAEGRGTMAIELPFGAKLEAPDVIYSKD